MAIAERDHPELGELAQLKDTYTFLLGVADQTLNAAFGEAAEAQPHLLSGTPLPEVKR